MSGPTQRSHQASISAITRKADRSRAALSAHARRPLKYARSSSKSDRGLAMPYYRRSSSRTIVNVRLTETPLAMQEMMSQSVRLMPECKRWAPVLLSLDVCMIATPDPIKSRPPGGWRVAAVGRRSRPHHGGNR